MHTNEINAIFQNLFKNYPRPKTELKFINNFTFLVSIVLSAQATDVSVNQATKDLFKIAKTPEEMLVLGEQKLKKYINTSKQFTNVQLSVVGVSECKRISK